MKSNEKRILLIFCWYFNLSDLNTLKQIDFLNREWKDCLHTETDTEDILEPCSELHFSDIYL